MSTIYNADYFIAKFEAIPEERWCVGAYASNGVGCAIHQTDTESEAMALTSLFPRELGERVSAVNDGLAKQFQQPTPRARILAALQAVKEKEGKC